MDDFIYNVHFFYRNTAFVTCCLRKLLNQQRNPCHDKQLHKRARIPSDRIIKKGKKKEKKNNLMNFQYKFVAVTKHAGGIQRRSCIVSTVGASHVRYFGFV
jgi:hypothetical protein